MHNIKWIEENPKQFIKLLDLRKITNITIDDVLKLINSRKQSQTKLQEMQSVRNKMAKEIGLLLKNGKKEDAQKIKEDVAKSKQQEDKLEDKAKKIDQKLNDLLMSIPNIMLDDTPIGDDEKSNLEIKKWGEPTKFDFTPKEHFDLKISKQFMDFDIAGKMSGSRFVILKNKLAKLERSIANFMIDTLTEEHSLLEVSTPVLVRSSCLLGTGQLPKFSEDLYKIENHDLWLIPTAEVSLTNLVQQQIVSQEQLPMRLTALTQCFRSEAGSAGRDTKGMLRQHQFGKVEMVTVCEDGKDLEELDRMLEGAELVLQKLELPYRVVRLCSGDLGFSAKKTYDIEVWLPGQDTYREISSCSSTGQFQARRMNSRYKNTQTKKNQFVNTINGSGVAVGRCLIAVLENYQQEDGSVNIPKVLQPYMNGIKNISL